MKPRRSPAARRRSPSGVVVSIALHVLAIAALGRITFGSHSLSDFFQRDRSRPSAERVEFVRVGADVTAQGNTLRAGGDGRRPSAGPPADGPVESTPEPPALIAPTGTPVGVSPVTDSAAAPVASGGSGPLVGGGGPLRGLQPAFGDPVLWRSPSEIVLAPSTVEARIDSSIAVAIDRHLDSLGALPAQRDPGDWTIERGGKRWGIDREYIRLGDVSIPTAVLALLPLNVQGNPIALERERTFAAQRADIQYHQQRAAAADEFKAAVQRIRSRVEAERAARAKIAQRGPVRSDPP